MMRHALITILPFVTACASRAYVEEQVQASQGSFRGEVETLNHQLTSRLDEIAHDVETNKQIAAQVDDLAKARKVADQAAVAADQNGRAVAALGRDIELLRQTITSREEMQHKLDTALQRLVEATAEFQKHRADVDHSLTTMDVEVDGVRKMISAQDKRLTDFFYVQQKNLRRQKENLQAEVELINTLLKIMSGVEPTDEPQPDSSGGEAQAQQGGPGHNGSK